MDRRAFLRAGGLSGLALTAGAALAACGSSSGGSSGKSGKSKPLIKYGTPVASSNVFFAWYAIADKLGYFEEENVSSAVTTVATPTPLIQSGGVNAGVSAGAEFLPFVAANPSTDLISMWTQVPGSDVPYYWIVVPANSPVQSFKDLAGKKIGVIGASTSPWYVVDAVAQANGMDPNKDIHKTVVPAGAALIQAFKTGQIAAGAYVDAQVIAVNEALAGSPLVPLRLLELPSSLQKMGGGVNLMRRSTLEKNMDLYVGYNRALAKAFVFINANVQAGMAIHLETFPTLQKAGESKEAAITRLVSEVQPRLNESKQPSWSTADHPWGWTYPENFQVWLDVLPSLQGKNIDVNKLFTNDVVTAAYNFDVAAIQQQAQNYKVS
ncbi:MAG TPA: ABC transporter substrate-binding protein [Micromonosporaceae bacterium]